MPATGEQFSVRLSSPSVGVGFGTRVESLVTVQPRVIATFTIAADDLINVVTLAQDIVVVIERIAGLQTTAQLNYNTSQPRQPVVIGRLPPIQSAIPQVHFTQIQTSLTFNPGEESSSIAIPILSVERTPVAFLVQIGSPTQ